MSYYEATLSWLRDHWHELSPLRKRCFVTWLRIIRKEERDQRLRKEGKMPYDKYRNWKTGTLLQMNKLKEMVLKDIEETGEEIEKLEILDSFEVAVERAHTAELAEHLSNQILIIVQPFLTAAIQGKLPAAMPLSRPRRAPAPVEIKEEHET